jgi:hypothetical protein
MLVVGAIAAWPAYAFWETEGLLYVAGAVGLCAVPGAATLAWALWSARNQPQMLLITVLGGTGVRMFVVFAGVFLLNQLVPATGELGFLAMVAIFYMVSLALEMALLLTGLPSAPRQESAQA